MTLLYIIFFAVVIFLLLAILIFVLFQNYKLRRELRETQLFKVNEWFLSWREFITGKSRSWQDVALERKNNFTTKEGDCDEGD